MAVATTMPTVFYQDGFRFFFYSNEGTEPPHVHVERGDALGKWWLTDLSMQQQDGFSKAQLRTIRSILRNRHEELNEAWNDHFS